MRRVPAAVAVLPACMTIVALFGGALVGAVRTSLEPGPAGLAGEVSLDAWRAILADPAFLDSLLFTSWITLASTAISMIVAVGLAHLIRGRRRALWALFGLPVPVPHLLVAVVAVLWIGPAGVVDRLAGALPFELIRDRAGLGIMLVYVLKEAPFLTLLIVAVWGPEVRAREEAAATMGAGPLQRLRWVVWPRIAAPLSFGSLIVAAFVFGSFEVPLVVGPTYPKTLAVLALDAARTSELDGQARSASILLVTAAVTIVCALLLVRRARADE